MTSTLRNRLDWWDRKWNHYNIYNRKYLSLSSLSVFGALFSRKQGWEERRQFNSDDINGNRLSRSDLWVILYSRGANTYIYTSASRRRPLRFSRKNRGSWGSRSLTPVRRRKYDLPCWNPTLSTSCLSWRRFWYRVRYGRDFGSRWNTGGSRRMCRPWRKTFGTKCCSRAP